MGRAFRLPLASLATAIGLAAFAASAATAADAPIAPDNVVFDESGAVAAPLTEVAGDPEQGKMWVVDRKLGNCLACHHNADLANEPFQGEIGPPLDGAAERWETPQLRGIVVNSKNTFEGTMMPAFYRLSGINRPLPDFEGKTILSAQQVEDIVAYLQTLKN